MFGASEGFMLHGRSAHEAMNFCNSRLSGGDYYTSDHVRRGVRFCYREVTRDSIT